MSSKIYRYEVPVDDQWHTLELSGGVLHVAARGADTVSLWALHTDGGFTVDHAFRVFGTGQPLPDDAWHVGTALVPGSSLVWHLMERAA